MSRPRVRRVGEVLRRVADRLDPPRPAPVGEMKLVSRQELREIQEELMQMIDSLFYLSRRDGRGGDGLMWITRAELDVIIYFLQHELDSRDRDLETFERDPTVVLR